MRRAIRAVCLAPDCTERVKKSVARYCSIQCQQDTRYKQSVTAWLSGDHPGGNEMGVSKFVRRWLIEARGECCEICGWDQTHEVTGRVPIEVDHIGHFADHRPSNLRLLCPNCHSLTPNFKNLNGGSGRPSRRVKRAGAQSEKAAA
jgi:hypothetical protein